MRSLVLLVLLLAVTLTDAGPCQDHTNNGYYKFTKKHIVSDDFDRSSYDAWRRYLIKKDLCDNNRRVQSFLEKDDENNARRICNGRGVRYPVGRDNLCISRNRFTVHIVQITFRGNQCVVSSVERKQLYVVIACDVDGNQCLPVHYETQTDTPPRGQDICQPPTHRPRFSRVEDWPVFRLQ